MDQHTVTFESDLQDEEALVELDEQDLEQVSGAWGSAAAAVAVSTGYGSAAAAAAAAGGGAAAAAAAASGW